MNFFHHLATLAGLVTGLYTGRSGSELGLCLILMEVSNPSMHMIHIFRELGMNDSTIAEINKVRSHVIVYHPLTEVANRDL